MSQDNQITLRGYLTAEPKFYQKTPQATPVAEFRVGSTPRRLNRETGEWQDLPSSYYRVKCWRRLAINAASSLKKGDMVIIRGHFYMNNWIDNQQRPRSSLEIEADTVGHDLAYGWTHYLRGTRSSGNSAAVNAGEMARQDTGTADPGERDDEYVPDLEATGPDEAEETAPPPDAQAEVEAWAPGFSGVSPADALDAQGTAGGQAAPREGDIVEGGTPEPGDALAASGMTSDIDSLTSDVNSLEREVAPF
jgi:single-strand DNA-binding protein